MIMKTQDPKQILFVSENNGGAVPQTEYFTADEAMAFLEPRIRAMFDERRRLYTASSLFFLSLPPKYK